MNAKCSQISLTLLTLRTFLLFSKFFLLNILFPSGFNFTFCLFVSVCWLIFRLYALSLLRHVVLSPCCAEFPGHRIHTHLSWTDVCVLPDSYVEILTPRVTVFGERAYKDVLKIK